MALSSVAVPLPPFLIRRTAVPKSFVILCRLLLLANTSITSVGPIARAALHREKILPVIPRHSLLAKLLVSTCFPTSLKSEPLLTSYARRSPRDRPTLLLPPPPLPTLSPSPARGPMTLFPTVTSPMSPSKLLHGTSHLSDIVRAQPACLSLLANLSSPPVTLPQNVAPDLGLLTLQFVRTTCTRNTKSPLVPPTCLLHLRVLSVPTNLLGLPHGCTPTIPAATFILPSTGTVCSVVPILVLLSLHARHILPAHSPNSEVRLSASVALSDVIVPLKFVRRSVTILTQFLYKRSRPPSASSVTPSLQRPWSPLNTPALGEPKHPGLLLFTIWFLKFTMWPRILTTGNTV